MFKQLTDLNFKIITPLLAARYLGAWISKIALMNPPAEEHFGPSKASQMELFEGTVDVLKGMLRLNIEHFLKKRIYEKLGISVIKQL